MVSHITSNRNGRLDQWLWDAAGYILSRTAFFAFSVHLWASSDTESKKRPVAATMLTVTLLDGSIRLASGDSLNAKFLICWTLTPRYFLRHPELLNQNYLIRQFAGMGMF